MKMSLNQAIDITRTREKYSKHFVDLAVKTLIKYAEKYKRVEDMSKRKDLWDSDVVYELEKIVDE